MYNDLQIIINVYFIFSQSFIYVCFQLTTNDHKIYSLNEIVDKNLYTP